MQARYSQKHVWPLLLLALPIAMVKEAHPGEDKPARAASPAVNAADENTGTVAGASFYQADAKRPWRQARYYVTEALKGYLAEAVVALDGSELSKQPAPTRAAATVIDQKNFQFTPETVAIRA